MKLEPCCWFCNSHICWCFTGTINQSLRCLKQMQILEQRTQRTRTCLWITKAHRPDGSWIYLSSPQISYEPDQMDMWVQYKSSGQVVTTSIIVLLKIFMRLHGAFKKIISLLFVARVHMAQTSVRARQYARACAWKNTRSRMHGIQKILTFLCCLLNATPM